MAKKNRIPHKFQPWINARKKYLLSHAQIQMARELGFSPKRFGSMSRTKDQPWKLPLAEFIESQYEKRFGKTQPDEVLTIEQIAARHVERRGARKAANMEVEGRAKAAARREAKLQASGEDAAAPTTEPETDAVINELAAVDELTPLSETTQDAAAPADDAASTEATDSSSTTE
jgi:hypothetical protein